MVPVKDLESSASDALDEFNQQRPYLKEGRTPPPVKTDQALTITELADHFLNAKRRPLNADEITPRTFRDYYDTCCSRLVKHLGEDRRVDDLRPADFAKLRSELSKRWRPTTLKNETTRARVLFKFAWDERLIEQPVHFGQAFNRPSAKQLRRVRNEAGPRLFTAEEIRRILAEADPQMRAMVLLGINCGFGNTDVASLPQSAVDLDAGWIEFPRPKTEIPRRIPLWPETVEALREAIAHRPKPKDPDDEDLCFITREGNPWVRVVPKRSEGDQDTYVCKDSVGMQCRDAPRWCPLQGG